MSDDDRVVAGRYRLGARIGSGAMGIVWQAHDDRLHRTVAVKQLLLQPGLTPAQAEEAHRRSMREGRIAARLAHPNAITVYDVAEHDGEPWLIMEYLPSRSLATVLDDQVSLAPVEAARIGTEVAAALVAAHAAGIVHRDVKPANVLLGDDGTVKITDFGISRATGDVTVTATGMLAGTPAYLAPEVAKGHQPTPASDVFSLGSTLYTAVEGHSPFGMGENTLALLYAVAAGNVKPPRQAGPLTALLMRLLRTDPAERPTMGEAKEALAAVAAGKPTPVGAGVTNQIAPHRQPAPPIPPPAPPRGNSMTRLDAHPLAEPAPIGPGRAVRHEPPSQPPARVRPAGAPRRSNRPHGGDPSRPPRGRTGSRKRDTRAIVLTVLAIVAAALVGVLVASLLMDNRQTPQAQTPDRSSTAADPPASNQKPSASPSTSSSPPTTSTSQQPAGADQENAVRQYYALLPAGPDSAWSQLTARAQQKSGSQNEYNKFWARIKSVEVLSTQADGNRVAATLRFVTTEGKQSTEGYFFTVVQQGNKLMIDNFVQTGRQGENNGGDEG